MKIFLNSLLSFLLCFTVLVSVSKKNCGHSTPAASSDYTSDHHHQFSISGFISYIFSSSVEHTHDHDDEDSDGPVAEHKHEHKHSFAHQHSSSDFLLAKNSWLPSIETLSIYTTENQKAYYSTYKFKIFRPPISI